MKTKHWQKTVITWMCHGVDWETNISVTDLKGSKGLMHVIRNMKAVSVTNTDMIEARTAILTFDVIRGCIGPTTRKAEIIKRLNTLHKSAEMRYVKVSASEFGSGFKISFNLRRSFCEEVIEFMREFFAVLGIKDPRNYRLSDFEVESTTMSRQGEGWIPFTDDLKLRFGFLVGELSVEMMPNTDPLC
ncbi:MAG: hypothetical protein WC673_02875 [Candidatus Paceibacterota bacterium]|jgi:hypothetical protein